MIDPIVITSVGLVSPLGNSIAEFRQNLLSNKSGIVNIEREYIGVVPAGECGFPEERYRSRKDISRGTKAGTMSIYCAHECLKDAQLDLKTIDRSRVGIFIGIAEHGLVESEKELLNFIKTGAHLNNWSPFHNFNVLANAPAGEVSINLGITGPAYTLGGACSAGLLSIIHGVNMLQTGVIDFALVGGVSSSASGFGVFASFMAQGLLSKNIEFPEEASRPLDSKRNGLVVSDGACLLLLERKSAALVRKAKILAEISGFCINSDGDHFSRPNGERQKECMIKALAHAGLVVEEIDLVNLHATGTNIGDAIEYGIVNSIFSNHKKCAMNTTKGHIGHTFGASGALEIASNLLSFKDHLVYPCRNFSESESGKIPSHFVLEKPRALEVKHILKNSFGMFGLNIALIVSSVDDE